MALLVSDIIKDALGLIHAIGADETPTDAEYAQALRTLNVMIDRWSSQRLLLRSTTPLSFTCTPGKGSYTIGTSGCDITASKPMAIKSAYRRDFTSLDIPVDTITIEEYNQLTDKDVSLGEIMYLAYDPGAAQQASNKGTIYLYYKPSFADTVYMECDTYFTEFALITEEVTFEPAYYEALIYNLAVRLFRYYRDANIQIPADIASIARESLSNLKTMNSVRIVSGMDLPSSVTKYNIYTDG